MIWGISVTFVTGIPLNSACCRIDRFTLGKVDAEGFIARHVTVLPLDFADFGDCLI